MASTFEDPVARAGNTRAMEAATMCADCGAHPIWRGVYCRECWCDAARRAANELHMMGMEETATTVEVLAKLTIRKGDSHAIRS